MIEICDTINEQIGFGCLTNADPVNYTVAVDMCIPPTGDANTIPALESLVTNAVKVWLLYHAPSETRTALVCAVEN